jgi:hypothetical protein
MRRGPDCLSGSQTTAEISSLNTIARAETGINRPAPPPFSFIMARRRRWLAALIVVRRLFTDQIKQRSSASLQLCKTISVFELPPTSYDSIQLMNGSRF